MRRKFGVSLLVTLVFLLSIVVPATAITYGEPDNGAHPYVGLIGFYDASGNWLWRCSGTLVAPKVLLTAGHCTSPDGEDVPAKAQVWFDEQIFLEPGVGYPDFGGVLGTPVANPSYHGLYLPNTNDVGVVLLDTTVTDRGFAALPPLGYLNKLANKRGLQDVTFTDVGYGINEVKPESISLRIRFKAVSHLVNLKSALTDGFNLQTSNNPGNWVKSAESGGTCFGDSGGPVFYSNTNMVVAVTSFGLNNNCKGTDFGFRIDTESARAFLGAYIPLP